MRDCEGCPADRDYQDLSANYNELNADKEEVALYAFEYIEPIVEASTVPLVEYLHPDKGIEDCCLHVAVVITPFSSVARDGWPSKI